LESLSFADVPNQTIALAGDLDLAVRSELQRRFDEAGDTATNVTLDLREVTYMDSSAIGAMIALHRRLREKGGNVRFFLRKNAAYRLLEIAGLVDAFPTEVEE
jgi:anti-sigma B factor antagonist